MPNPNIYQVYKIRLTVGFVEQWITVPRAVEMAIWAGIDDIADVRTAGQGSILLGPHAQPHIGLKKHGSAA